MNDNTSDNIIRFQKQKEKDFLQAVFRMDEKLQRAFGDVAILEQQLEEMRQQKSMAENERKLLSEKYIQYQKEFFDQYTTLQKEFISQVNKVNQKDILLFEKDRYIQSQEHEANNLRNQINKLSSLVAIKDADRALMQASKFWKLRDFYLRSKWALRHPYKFFKKYFLRGTYFFKKKIVSQNSVSKNKIRHVAGDFVVTQPRQFYTSLHLNEHDVAVIMHLYHTEMWDYMREKLAYMPCSFTLIVSLTENHYTQNDIDAIKRSYPDAKIVIYPNKGMDILPFLKSLKLVPKSTKHLLKMHTKKSVHIPEIGNAWFEDLIDHVLPSREGIDAIFHNLECTNIGMIGGSPVFDPVRTGGKALSDFECQGILHCSEFYETKINAIYNYFKTKHSDYHWVAGSMFWVRFDIINKFDDSFIDFFEKSQPLGYVIDSTLAHGLERYFGKLVYDSGKIISLCPQNLKEKSYETGLVMNEKVPMIHNREIIMKFFASQNNFFLDLLRKLKDKIFKGSNKIIIVGHDAHFAGAQFLALSIIKELKEKFKFTVYVILKSGGILEGEYKRYATVYNLSESYQTRHQKIGLIRQLKSRGVKFAIANTVVAGDIVGLLHDEDVMVASLIHELPGSIRKYEWIDYAQTIAEKADYIIFPSHFVKDGFTEIVKNLNGTVKIRAQGLIRQNTYKNNILEARKLLRRDLCLNEDTIIILGVGGGDTRKGVDLFLDVASRVKNPKIKFVWIGDMASDMQKLVDQQKKHIKNVIFIKTTSEISMYYAGADIYLLTSREDPFPSVVVESMSVGVPVIGFQGAGGFVDIVTEKTGILVPYLDTNAMVQAIDKLISNNNYREMLCKNSIDLIAREFVFEDYVRDLLDIFDFQHKSNISPLKTKIKKFLAEYKWVWKR